MEKSQKTHDSENSSIVFKERINLDMLNFVGSVCSITALLMVVFKEMNWLKGLNIIVGIVFIFCCGAALLSVLRPWVNQKLGPNIFAIICGNIVMMICLIFILIFIFFGIYEAMDFIETLIIGMVES